MWLARLSALRISSMPLERARKDEAIYHNPLYKLVENTILRMCMHVELTPERTVTVCEKIVSK